MMPRHKLGHAYSMFSRKITKTTTSPTGTTSTTPTLPDPPAVTYVQIDTTADPMPITVNVPASTAAMNTLIGLSAIAIPFGSGKPSNADAWLASAYPKVTIGLAPAPATTQVPASTAPVASTVAPVTTAPATVVANAPTTAVATEPAAVTTVAAVSQPTATVATSAVPVSVVASTPAPATAPVEPYLPASATGGQITLLLAGVPDGNYEIQLVETYDV